MLDREEVAVRVLAGLCANKSILNAMTFPGCANTLPRQAVDIADGLLWALKQSPRFKSPDQQTQPDVTKNSEG